MLSARIFLRQEDSQFKASLGQIVRSCYSKQKQNLPFKNPAAKTGAWSRDHLVWEALDSILSTIQTSSKFFSQLIVISSVETTLLDLLVCSLLLYSQERMSPYDLHLMLFILSRTMQNQRHQSLLPLNFSVFAILD